MASKQTSKANETGFLNSGNNKPCITKSNSLNNKKGGISHEVLPFCLDFFKCSFVVTNNNQTSLFTSLKLTTKISLIKQTLIQ